jgi:AmmeMemoRadiSam system protein B
MTRVIRQPAVAGTFYPADAGALRVAVNSSYDGARETTPSHPVKMLVVPHAGYVYSGPVAASAYRLLGARAADIDRVVVIGPSHRVPLRGIAATGADLWRTPLGDMRVSAPPGIPVDDAPHAMEHSLEVQLPFVQQSLGDVAVVPLVVGHAPAEQVADVLDDVWGDDETLVLVSTDLSHYEDYETAARQDRRTADAVVEQRVDDIGDRDACGAYPLRGALLAASRRGLTTTLLDLRSSGDTAGSHDRVVGYGAFAIG